MIINTWRFGGSFKCVISLREQKMNTTHMVKALLVVTYQQNIHMTKKPQGSVLIFSNKTYLSVHLAQPTDRVLIILIIDRHHHQLFHIILFCFPIFRFIFYGFFYWL